MFPSIFTDELGLDITEALPIIASWGLRHVDLRGRVFGKAFEALPAERLPELRALLDAHDMKVGCLESSLAKVHLPDAERCKAEAEKLEGIIRAADALDCRMVRAFFYWQPGELPAPQGERLAGQLAVRPDEQQKVLDLFAPLAERARAAGLILAFENCGVTPDEVLTMLNALGVPHWGLAWDVNNDWRSPVREADETAYLLRLAKRAKLLHVKARGAVAGLGEQVPYDRVLQVCHNAGVPGPVSAETHNPDPAVNNVEMCQRVVHTIKQAWPSAAPGGLFDAPKSMENVTRPWQDNPVCFAVVGLGMGHRRAKEIMRTPGNQLACVCDMNEERARRTAEECGVPFTTDYAEVLARDDVDVVFILTKTGLHGELAIQAMEAGKHALVTKPMEASLDACDRMIRVAEERGLLLAVDFDRRFTDELHTLKAALDNGRFGRMLGGRCSLKLQRSMEYFREGGGWRGTRRWDGGGVLANQSIHHIDELAFVLGIPAQIRCDIWTQTHDIEAEDLAVATWRYADGAVITFTATSSYPQSTWYVQTELEGAEGAFSRIAGGPFETPQTRWFIDGAWSDCAPDPAKAPWLNATDNFAAALRAGAPLTCPARDARRTQSILDAMYHSAYERNGAWVDISTTSVSTG